LKLPDYPITQLQNGQSLILVFEEMTMQAFHIRYRNTQGTLMRILNAASRRGLDLASVQAGAAEQDHHVTLQMEVTHKQAGQLYREWYAIVDVTDVHSGNVARDSGQESWASPHPPASASVPGQSAHAALA
jgi:acetolactate synthase regulatory subunit